MRMVSAKELIGKTIVGFDSGAMITSRGAVHDPRIYLDDGSVLYFMAEETDDDYGIFVGRTSTNVRAKENR